LVTEPLAGNPAAFSFKKLGINTLMSPLTLPPPSFSISFSLQSLPQASAYYVHLIKSAQGQVQMGIEILYANSLDLNLAQRLVCP